MKIAFHIILNKNHINDNIKFKKMYVYVKNVKMYVCDKILSYMYKPNYLT